MNLNIIAKLINVGWSLSLLVLVSCIALMFFNAIPYQDELAYAYKSAMSSGECANLERCKTFADIYRQQKREYLENGQGRVLIHSILAFFAVHRLNYLFRALSVAIWFFFCLGILKHGRVCIAGAKDLFEWLLFLWLVLWQSETTIRDASYSINYLWCATFLLWAMHCWLVDRSWWYCLLGLLLGLSQETFALPAICTLLSATLLKFCVSQKTKYRFSARQLTFLLLLIAGTAFLLSSPAGQRRAGETVGSLFSTLCKSSINFALYIWPFLLFIALCYLVYRKIQDKSLVTDFLTQSEWWLFTLFSFGMLLLLGRLGVRTMMPFQIGGCILLLQNRQYFIFLMRVRKIALYCGIFWLISSAVIQTQCGIHARETIRHYLAKPDGCTMYRPVKLGPFVFACYQIKWLRGTNRLVQADSSKDAGMLMLPPDIYYSLYEGKADFWAKAQPIVDELYCLPNQERCVIQKGNAPLTFKQAAALQNHFHKELAKKNRISRILPQRIILAWARDDYYTMPPLQQKNTADFIGADGKLYTAHFCRQLEFE